jgi:hypothetical protein
MFNIIKYVWNVEGSWCYLYECSCAKLGKWAVMYMCVRGIDCASHPALQITKKVHSTRSASDKAYQLLAHGRGSLRVLRLLPPLKLVAMI